MRAEERIAIRKASVKDADSIIDVVKSTKLAGETWSGEDRWVKNALQKFLGTENYTLLVAEYYGKIVGFVDCSTFPSFWEGSNQGIINHLFVHAKFQGKGIGSRLI